jgi:Predicted nucleotide-binding protein containing TIR-like domain
MPNLSGMTVSVLLHPGSKSLPSITEAISTVNQIQPYFRLKICWAKWLPNDTKKKVTGDETKKLIRKRHAKWPAIGVIQNLLRGGWFDYQSQNYWIISTAQWDEHFAPPPLKIYLIYEFACALAAFVADLHDEQLDAMSHKKRLRACVFDQTSGRREFLVGLVAAHLCARCEGRLSEMGVSDKAIEAIFSILAFVRDFAIRRPRSPRSAVFVGHGRSPDWKSVDSFLRDKLDLNVEEFNRDPAAGVHTTDRLSEMLNMACFALLVMTPEDLHDDGKIHARENVVHEIGLFQGKLGFKKSIVVKQNRTASFSNIAGLTYIPYPKGKIDRAFPEIVRTMVREGVVDSIVGDRFLRRTAPPKK